MTWIKGHATGPGPAAAKPLGLPFRCEAWDPWQKWLTEMASGSFVVKSNLKEEVYKVYIVQAWISSPSLQTSLHEIPVVFLLQSPGCFETTPNFWKLSLFCSTIVLSLKHSWLRCWWHNLVLAEGFQGESSRAAIVLKPWLSEKGQLFHVRNASIDITDKKFKRQIVS